MAHLLHLWLITLHFRSKSPKKTDNHSSRGRITLKIQAEMAESEATQTAVMVMRGGYTVPASGTITVTLGEAYRSQHGRPTLR